MARSGCMTGLKFVVLTNIDQSCTIRNSFAGTRDIAFVDAAFRILYNSQKFFGMHHSSLSLQQTAAVPLAWRP